MTTNDVLDIVVFGATGFVGRLTADHLARSAPPQLRIGLAGRNRAKLAAVAADLPTRPGAAGDSGDSGDSGGWPLIEADALDPASMASLAQSARVVLSTVGPYASYGLPLVEACAAAGTDYVDLTDEALFVRDSIDQFHQRAEETGARIIHSCGFDSVPSDLGVFLTAHQAQLDDAGTLTSTTNDVRVRGGLSGGTLASMKGQVDAIVADRSRALVVLDRYGLSPARAEEPEPPGRTTEIILERGPKTWRGPFIMAPFNSQIVRRSNALTDWSYGRAFRYREMVDTGKGLKGAATALGMAAVVPLLAAGLQNRFSRPVLDRLLPDPGEGPSDEARDRGRFRMDIRSETTTGRRYRTEVSADYDPGYNGTAIMIGEAAIGLALARRGEGSGTADGDGPTLPERAGVLTPATGLGMVLVERLRDQGFVLRCREERWA